MCNLILLRGVEAFILTVQKQFFSRIFGISGYGKW